MAILEIIKRRGDWQNGAKVTLRCGHQRDIGGNCGKAIGVAHLTDGRIRFGPLAVFEDSGIAAAPEGSLLLTCTSNRCPSQSQIFTHDQLERAVRVILDAGKKSLYLPIPA